MCPETVLSFFLPFYFLEGAFLLTSLNRPSSFLSGLVLLAVRGILVRDLKKKDKGDGDDRRVRAGKDSVNLKVKTARPEEVQKRRISRHTREELYGREETQQ